MREIPSLSILALRAVGPPACNPEVTFGGPRAARKRPADGSSSDSDNEEETGNDNSTPTDNNKEQGKEDKEASASLPPPEPTVTSRLLRSLRDSTQSQRPYVGSGRPNAKRSTPGSWPPFPRGNPTTMPRCSSRRINEAGSADATSSQKEFLVIDHSNRAIECLQLFLDALMESGRAGDSRLGVHFFREWVAAVTGEVPSPHCQEEGPVGESGRNLLWTNRCPSVR
ncbi:hypothetical protein ACHAXT_010068 [Thalassiosira profunda]